MAQRFVIDHPDRVERIALMGAFSTFDDPGLVDFVASTIAPLTDPIAAPFAREWQLSTLARAMPADHLDAVVSETLKVPARVWREAARSQWTVRSDASRVGTHEAWRDDPLPGRCLGVGASSLECPVDSRHSLLATPIKAIQSYPPPKEDRDAGGARDGKADLRIRTVPHRRTTSS